MTTPKEPVEVSMRYFYIKTDRLEQFLTEIDKVCQRFAVRNEIDKGLEYGYHWEGI